MSRVVFGPWVRNKMIIPDGGGGSVFSNDYNIKEVVELLQDVKTNADRLTFNVWYATNSHRFEKAIALLKGQR